MTTADDVSRASREFATLVQRAGPAALPGWVALTIAGALKFFGVDRPGDMGPGLVAILAATAGTLWLVRRHRARFGRVTATHTVTAMVFVGVLLVSLPLTFALGTKFVPSPVLLVGGVGYLGVAILGETRVSMHYVVPAAGWIWMSMLSVVGPPALFHEGIESMVIGVTCAFAAIVDGVQTERVFREVKRVVHPGGAHVL